MNPMESFHSLESRLLILNNNGNKKYLQIRKQEVIIYLKFKI